MTYPMYAMRDEKTGFLAPQIEQNENSAKRNFQYAIGKPDTMLSEFAKDYDLFKVGEYDTDTGIITPLNPPEIVMSGYSVLAKKEG